MTKVVTDHLSLDIYANNPSYRLLKSEPSFMLGRKVEKLTYRSSLHQVQKIGSVALAVLTAVATLFIALCFKSYRQFWINTLLHFSDHIAYKIVSEQPQEVNPLHPSHQLVQSAPIVSNPLAVLPATPLPVKVSQEVVPQPSIVQEVVQNKNVAPQPVALPPSPSQPPVKIVKEAVPQTPVATEVAQPDLSSPILQKKREDILKTNPEYQPAVDSWDKLKIPLTDQLTRLDELKSYAFGTDKWKTYFAMSSGKIPTLPCDIYEMLNEVDHVKSGSKIKDTHVLVLVPCMLRTGNNDLMLTVPSLGYLKRYQMTGYPCPTPAYSMYEEGSNPKIKKIDQVGDSFNFNELRPKASHWALMTKSVIPENLSGFNRTLKGSPAILTDYNVKAKSIYHTPEAIDVAACCILHFVDTGERLLDRTKDPKSILCNEYLGKGKYSAGIGGLNKDNEFVYMLSDSPKRLYPHMVAMKTFS